MRKEKNVKDGEICFRYESDEDSIDTMIYLKGVIDHQLFYEKGKMNITRISQNGSLCVDKEYLPFLEKTLEKEKSDIVEDKRWRINNINRLIKTIKWR